jgi:hypothetical protein
MLELGHISEAQEPLFLRPMSGFPSYTYTLVRVTGHLPYISEAQEPLFLRPMSGFPSYTYTLVRVTGHLPYDWYDLNISTFFS